MTFFDPDTKCPRCDASRMIYDRDGQECACPKCGLVTPVTDGLTAEDDSRNSMQKPRFYHLGSNRKSVFLEKDHAGHIISSKVRHDLITASKYDREQVEREEAAVSHIAEIYERVTYPQYDDGLKKGDLEILKQRAKNMVDATGERQRELDLMKIIRKFLRVKLGKNPELKKYFKLDLLPIKIRYQRIKPKNISGRGNQLGKKRKEGRIEYCNICKAEIANYKVRKHHAEHHNIIPYHQYIDKKNQHVRRSASLTDIMVDCAAAKERPACNVERGMCTTCNVSDAIIQRYPRVKVTRKGRVDIVSRLVARHKDSNGRWKVCILQQRKIVQK